ncbi:hypothetical protein M0R45_024944 [Rubus argutus]|uniref:non-specific serine/threonine protein kinase n=1 Tax=Rubus argutus TaxID=59490 RepID=A0AAW1WU07_RUBAR
MKCFFPFKSKTKQTESKSAPELRNRSDSLTSALDQLQKVGEGGFGSVYKGTIKPKNGKGSPILVAIKKLNPHSLQGHKEWLAEVQFLGVDYMPNRSLEHHLFNRVLSPLPWITRLQIMLGAAQGLAYLHEGLEVQVIYRDFKSSNVLLDENFNAKLSDFGLAREGPQGDRTHVSTAVVGTYGYAAPEYVETGLFQSIATYGVLVWCLEILRQAIQDSQKGTSSSVNNSFGASWSKLSKRNSK